MLGNWLPRVSWPGAHSIGKQLASGLQGSPCVCLPTTGIPAWTMLGFLHGFWVSKLGPWACITSQAISPSLSGGLQSHLEYNCIFSL